MKSTMFTKALTAFFLVILVAGYATAQETPQNDGTKEGADVENDDVAKNQDQKDMVANAEAVNEGLLGVDGNSASSQEPQIAEANAAGGVGGVDPATGETLLPLPATSTFCQSSGKPAADGSQLKDGSCSSLPQGQIPIADKMVSTIIVEPANLATIELGKEFTVSVVTSNLKTGFFTEAKIEYYTQPQTLDNEGNVKGHQHITIQRIADKTRPPNANDKQFFKGLNDKADGSGRLSVTVDADALKEPGLYRICSMTGAFSHQPVVMPVAQRGSQDDCIRVDVVDPAGNGGNGDGNNEGNGDGDNEGNGDGNNEGNGDGNNEGNGDGNNEGNGDGNNEGNGDGNNEGNGDGNNEGNGDGNNEGNGDGNAGNGNNQNNGENLNNENGGPERGAITQQNPPANNGPARAPITQTPAPKTINTGPARAPITQTPAPITVPARAPIAQTPTPGNGGTVTLTGRSPAAIIADIKADMAQLVADIAELEALIL